MLAFAFMSAWGLCVGFLFNSFKDKKMSLLKKSVFATIFTFPLIGFLSLALTSEKAFAGFKWNPPSKQKSIFPKSALKSKKLDKEILWRGDTDNKKTNITPEKLEIEPAELKPITSEILDIPKNTQENIKDSNIKFNFEDDIIAKVVKEENTHSPYIPSLKVKDAKVIQGFGNDVPLVLAIRQIIPTNRAFAFDKGVNLSKKISWNGGDGWDKILSDTLAKAQLRAYERDGIIIIAPASVITSKAVATPSSAKYIKLPEPPQYTEIKTVDIVQQNENMPIWQAHKGQTLNNIIKLWSERENVQILWNTNYDYRLHKNLKLTGTYEDALASLLDEFAELRPQPYGKLSKDENGQRILTIDVYHSM